MTEPAAPALSGRMGPDYYSREEILEFEWGALGDDVQIKRNVGIPFTRNVYLGDHIRIDDGVIIVASNDDEPVEIGSHVHLSAGGYLAGSDGITLGLGVTLAPYVQIFSGSDDYSGERLTNPTWERDLIGGAAGRVTIGDHVIIGAGSVVHPDLTIAEGCSVGSLSLVRGSLDAWGVYAGIPVRRIRDRRRDLLTLADEALRRERAEAD